MDFNFRDSVPKFAASLFLAPLVQVLLLRILAQVVRVLAADAVGLRQLRAGMLQLTDKGGTAAETNFRCGASRINYSLSSPGKRTN